MASELDDDIYSKIVELSEEGDSFLEEDSFEQAIEKYNLALSLLPKPIEEWEASTWLLTSIGEAYFFNENYEDALQTLQLAMHCPDAIGNPLIHLRLGQVQLEIGNELKAKDELVRAYMGGGEEVFEDELPKYFDLVKQSIDIPESD